MQIENQEHLLDTVERIVNRKYRSKSTAEAGEFQVPVPYGTTQANKLSIAEWLVGNFPNGVICLKDGRFREVTQNHLIAANVYYVKV